MGRVDPFQYYAALIARAPVFEPWEITTYRPKPKHKRIHKPTLAKAMRQARKAGVTPVAATINPDGSVSLMFPRSDGDSPFVRSPDGNEWDSVLQ